MFSRFLSNKLTKRMTMGAASAFATFSVLQAPVVHAWGGNSNTSTLPSNTTLVESKAITRLFTIIRDKRTENEQYVYYCDRLLRILAEEGIANLTSTKAVTVDTPCGKYKGLQSIPYREMCAVSVMRSGDILLEAVRLVAPGIAVGKILVQRDESHPDKIPILYYSKLPEEISQMQVLLVDPMLATGGSAKMSIDVLVAAGAREENITFLNVVSCPEGLTALNKAYPRVRVITTAVDDKLDGHKYIVPGVGDFGDRYYRT